MYVYLTFSSALSYLSLVIPNSNSLIDLSPFYSSWLRFCIYHARIVLIKISISAGLFTILRGISKFFMNFAKNSLVFHYFVYSHYLMENRAFFCFYFYSRLI